MLNMFPTIPITPAMHADLRPETLSEFWRWFAANEEELFNLDINSRRMFDELSDAMSRVDANLTYEFGPILENKRELFISAGGNKESFQSVRALYAASPGLERWTFIQFRQRHKYINDFKLGYGHHVVKASDVRYLMVKDKKPGKVGITLFLDGYSEMDWEAWEHIGYLFLDIALGEYDVETYVGAIMFSDHNSVHLKRSLPYSSLPKHFDKSVKTGCRKVYRSHLVRSAR